MEQMITSISLNDEKEIRKSFKMISYLLQYPDKKWLQWGELIEELEEFNNSVIKNSLMDFLEGIGKLSLDDLEQHYVNIFDFNPDCSLSLSYLKAGEQRERGQILVELKELYREHGYEMTDEELSDYLPVVLEIASVVPLQITVNLLMSFLDSINKLKSELERLNSPYVFLINVCLFGMEALKGINLSGGRG